MKKWHIVLALSTLPVFVIGHIKKCQAMWPVLADHQIVFGMWGFVFWMMSAAFVAVVAFFWTEVAK